VKVLTLTQPWATLVAIGAKHIETRSWETLYRGPLAIHAAAGYSKGGRRGHQELCGTEPFCSVLSAHGKRWLAERGGLADMVAHPLMPLGAIVATCELVDCVQVLYEWPRNQLVSQRSRHILTDQERAFGDYTPGRFAWLLASVRPLATPIPAKGALGLWTWDGDL
jgi:hypothetical protein